ncbi:GNAT family N-acetyltransferase [Neobacillus sp. NPDC093127]|uniref:GNAT family N-acetyltransferase n=1 Tax=Neobacillus sp. NPDC093127 TaxID=3364296 RepID=UPI00381A8E68
MKIVEYRHDLAEKVADMWNHSREGWGGGNDISTAESVRQQEENSINLNTYLAMDENGVAGYCGVSEYREDSGALYIPLLNVREEYQGKKIGKQLVLKAVERTIELGWQRLDLYTWGGNIKAVPLYKKCGFFWENRDDTVHLMNFIPSVLTTEAVQGFFEKADWYHDRKMEIEVKPDGRKESGFDFYEYKWEKDGQRLRMEYERKGRGLRLIETDEYLISASIEQQDLIFGAEYPIQFKIENKTNEPLTIAIEGFDDQNIHFDFGKQLTVMDSEIVEGRFFVGEITEEQNIWRTHPTVAAKVTINGKEATFKLGINSKYPAKVTAKIPNELPFLESDSELYLELENHFNEEVQFSFTWPKAHFIDFADEQVQIMLGAKERKLLPIPYRLTEYGFYQQPLQIKAVKKSGETIYFSKKIGLAFYGMSAKLTGECDDYWHAYNGLAHVYLSKFDNRLYFGRAGSAEEEIPFFFYPKLGKPFSSEFSKKRPDHIEFFEEKGALCLKAVYHSQSFPDLQLHSIAKVYAEGLMEHHYQIHNLADAALMQEIWLNDSHNFVQSMYGSVFPYDGQMIEVNELKDGMIQYWQSEKLDENWIFKRDSALPSGICWSSETKVQFEHWFLFFEHKLGVIPAKGVAKTQPTYLSMGAFPTWEAFRRFALKKVHAVETATAQPAQFYPENHNPFVQGQTSVHYKDVRLAHLDGEVSIQVDGQESEQKQHLSEKDAKREAVFPLHFEGGSRVKLLKLNADLKLEQSSLRSLIICTDNTAIQTEQYVQDGVPVYEVDNGLVSIKAAPDFFPALYSLTYKGHEWLDTSFPALMPKSWWNPWAGGIRNALLNISSNSLVKEERSAGFVTITDNKGNRWTGIKLQVQILQHESFKGLIYNQYYLLQPGAPVMCHTTEILQDTNQYFKNEGWYSQAAFKNVENSWVEYYPSQKAYFGKGEMEIDVKQSFIIGHEAAPEKLQVISDYQARKSELYLNKEVAHHTVFSKLSLQHGETYWTAPIFYLFNGEKVPEDALQDIKNIRFNGAGN